MIFFWFLLSKKTRSLTLSCVCCSFIHKTNTVEFKSATFPNAGSRHLLDDSVLESHTPTRGQAESSTLSSGISLGITHKHIQKAIGSWAILLFYQYMSWSCHFRKQWRLGAQWGDVLACLWEVSPLKHASSQRKWHVHIHDHMRGYMWTQHVFMEHAGIPSVSSKLFCTWNVSSSSS